jgi:small subunit ribosomal protein S27Ae
MSKHEKSQIWEKYEDDGSKNHSQCPRCGSFLADHEDRMSCGKCGYTKHQ